MAHVVAGSECWPFTGGASTFDVEAATVRELITALDARFPGLGDFIDRRMAFAIDGEIHQNAWFHLGKFDKGISTEYNIKAKGNGVYVFVLSGDIKVNDQLLNTRDGYGIWDTDKFTITAETDAEFLLMEVPMEF